MAPVLIGLVVLAGWALHNPKLVQVLPGLVGMTINTAISLVLAGLLLALPRLPHSARVFGGGLLVVLGSTVLLENIFSIDLGIDATSLQRWLSDTKPYPGRMAPNTCIGVIVIGLALTLSGTGANQSSLWLRRALAIATIVVGLSGLFGYFIKAELLYDLQNVARMALHTALGISLLGLGLWFEMPRSLTHEEGHGILPMVAVTLIVIATTASVSVFAFMQHRIERMTTENLLRQHNDRSLYFSSTILQRTTRAQTITTRPGALAQMRKLQSTPGDPASIASLQSVARSYLPHGFNWVAFHQHGRQLTGAGALLTASTMEVPLRGASKRELLWRDGYHLRVQLAMHDGNGLVGEVVAEQPLEVLNQLADDTNHWGRTGEMVVCLLSTPEFRCFPERFRDEPFTVPHVMNNQPLPMALVLDGASGITSSSDFRRQRVLAAYGPIGDLGLGMVIKMDRSELYAPIRDLLHLMLVALALVVALSLWILHGRVRPLVQQLIDSRRAAQASEARFLAAADSSIDGFYILECARDARGEIVDFRFTYLNDVGARLISRIPREKLIGQLMCQTLPLIRDTGHFDKYRRVVVSGTSFTEEFQISAPGVQASWLSQQVVRLGDGVAVTARDISERKAAEHKLIYLAQNDALTGLPNRTLFRDRLEQAMARARRHNKPMALMYLDIDHFKKINDSLGHSTGDEILRAFGFRVNSSVRATDTVARLAGDEFTVIVEDLTDPMDVLLIADKVLAALVPPVRMGEQEVRITSSIGIALYKTEGISTDEIIHRADMALYGAKKRGRNGYLLYTPDLEENGNGARVQTAKGQDPR